MSVFTRTPRYYAALNELADAIAEMPIEELADSTDYWSNEVRDHLSETLQRRHRRFAEKLSMTSLAIFEQQTGRWRLH